MEYRKINVILGWLVFAIATFVYVSTVEPTASFWDCGEYIATANRLEVGHPPGAPTFLLIGRVFSMLASPENVAYTINVLSALCSSFTIMFLFWTISAFGRKLATIRGEELNEGKTWAIFGSALVGSLAYTFSDTFWFSAVEGEVYAMASLLIAIVFWAILKWEQVANEPYADRWIIFIAYMIGLSVGVHLLSLLAIPAIAFVVYFKRYEPSAQGMAITGLIGVAVLGLVQNVIIPQVVNIASKFELFFVNSVGMPFNSGAILFLLLLTTGIIAGLYWTHQQRKPIVNTAILAFTAILIGYSSFAVILVRSQANTPIDENNPENMVNLLAYLNRDQYGTWPLLTGHYFNSTLDPQEPYTDGDPVYYPDEESGEYLISDSRKKSIPNYSKETTGFFPRMWSPQQKHIREYKKWSDFKGKRITVRDVTGQQKTIQKPRFSENMRYFGKYQIGHMYFRYFMWNFAGRQNDTQGHGGFRDGNWLTGIPFLDKFRLGNQEELSDDMLSHKARNELYMLPLLLGLIGLMFQFIRDPKNAFVVTLLFFFTGLAIIVYLNQYPIQPRERDYAYAASFYAFAIWIGLGVYALYEGLSKYGQNKLTAGAVTLTCLLL
ncbi:MAG: DUF2723 domain-containing protein, partial [Bacteroidota bacterium]